MLNRPPFRHGTHDQCRDDRDAERRDDCADHRSERVGPGSIAGVLQPHKGPADDSTEDTSGENRHERKDACQSGRNGCFDRFEYVGHTVTVVVGTRVSHDPRSHISICLGGRSVRLGQ